MKISLSAAAAADRMSRWLAKRRLREAKRRLRQCPRRWEPVRAGIPAVALFIWVTNSASKNFDCFRPDKRVTHSNYFLDFLLTV